MISITAHEGMLWISPPIPELQEALKFWNIETVIKEHSFLDKATNEMKVAKYRGGYKQGYENLYSLSEDGVWLITHEGLFSYVTDVLAIGGYQYTYRRTEPLPEFIFGPATVAGLRPEQVQAVLHALAVTGCQRRGGPLAAPGSAGALVSSTMSTGKTHMIAAWIRAFYYSLAEYEEIVVTTFRQSVVRRLYEGLGEILNSEGVQIGMVMTGSRNKQRVTICTIDSIMEMDPDNTRVIIYDEVHGASGTERSRNLLAFKRAVKFGCSGTLKKHPKLSTLR